MIKKLEVLHFPLWILKDAAWFFGLGKASLILAVPAAILAAILAYLKDDIEKLEWSLIFLWLVSNVFWMSSELISKDLHEYAKISWQVSLAFLPLYFFTIKKLLKDESEKV